MDFQNVVALAAFAVAMLWTPGPNNIMLASTGARFGFCRALPLILGINAGFGLMLFLFAFGLGELFKAQPLLRETLQWAGAALLLYIGWTIATAPTDDRRSVEKPWSFLQGVLFQWINPKAWSVGLAVASSFMTGTAPMREALVCMGVFMLVGLGSSSGWTAFGIAIQHYLPPGRARQTFNICMGLLVGLFVLVLIFDE